MSGEGGGRARRGVSSLPRRRVYVSRIPGLSTGRALTSLVDVRPSRARTDLFNRFLESVTSPSVILEATSSGHEHLFRAPRHSSSRAVPASTDARETFAFVSRRPCRRHCAGSAPSWRDRPPPVAGGRSVPGEQPTSAGEIFPLPAPSLRRSVPGERPPFTSAVDISAPAAARRRRTLRFPPRPSTPASSPRTPPSRRSPRSPCRTRSRAPAWRSGSCGSGCGSDSRLS